MISRVRPSTPALILSALTEKVPSAFATKAPGVEQVIQLQRHPEAVRFVDPEAQSAETGSEKGGVKRALHRLVDHPFVDQELQGEEAGDVGFRFLERAAGFLHFLAHGRGFAVDGDVVRAEAVHQFVHHDVGEEGVEGEILLVGRREHDLARSGSSVLANFASCTFFNITRFEPFSFVTRSSLGKLKAAVWTPWLASPAAKISFTTTSGARAPSFGLRYFGSIGR